MAYIAYLPLCTVPRYEFVATVRFVVEALVAVIFPVVVRFSLSKDIEPVESVIAFPFRFKVSTSKFPNVPSPVVVKSFAAKLKSPSASISSLSVPAVEKFNMFAPLDHIPVSVSPVKLCDGVPTAPSEAKKSDAVAAPVVVRVCEPKSTLAFAPVYGT